jgi:hypothetical protein
MKEQTQTNNVHKIEVTDATFQTANDLKTAVLIVSVLANVAIFTVWLLVQLTPRYDAVMTTWLFG